MLATWNIDWLNQNGQRRYPLADEANGLDQTASFSIPDDFIVGLNLPVHAGMAVAPDRFFILNIGAYATGYSVVVGYQPDTGDPVVVATALISRQNHTRNKVYALGGQGDFADSVGKIVIGRLDNIDNQPPGFFTFALDDTRLETDAIRPMIRGVSSLVLVNAGGQRSAPLYGDVELVAGNNMQLVPVIVSGQNPAVRLNAIAGEGTIEECVCTGDESRPAIKNINGINPTEDGAFTLVGDDCVQLTPINNGLRISDVCSRPCCGCAELEAVTRDLERLLSESKAVDEFVKRLEASVTSMDSIVLGARLGDRGCFTCG